VNVTFVASAQEPTAAEVNLIFLPFELSNTKKITTYNSAGGNLVLGYKTLHNVSWWDSAG